MNLKSKNPLNSVGFQMEDMKSLMPRMFKLFKALTNDQTQLSPIPVNEYLICTKLGSFYGEIQQKGNLATKFSTSNGYFDHLKRRANFLSINDDEILKIFLILTAFWVY